MTVATGDSGLDNSNASFSFTPSPPIQTVHLSKQRTDEKKVDDPAAAYHEDELQPLTTEILNRLDRAKTLAKDDKLLLAAHLLNGIDDRHLQPTHREIVREAAIFKKLLREQSDESNNGGWTKQGRHTGRHNFSIDYKLNKSNQRQDLSCRIETLIHSDLLVPILAVLNESELYSTWLPDYNVPRLKVVKSEKWRQSGRCSQIVNVETVVPWPLAARQVILNAVACDDIDTYPDGGESESSAGKRGGTIIIRLQSLDCSDNGNEGLTIPPAMDGVVRMKVIGCFTIQKCPKKHPLEEFSIQYDAKAAAKPESPISREDLILVTFTFCCDPQLANIPKSFINFFTRTAMGMFWEMFLNVAEEVKEGKRPAHSKAIEEKREDLYDWIEERTGVMLGM